MCGEEMGLKTNVHLILRLTAHLHRLYRAFTCHFCIRTPVIRTCWYLLVCCFGFNGPFRQYFSLYRAVSQREGGIKEERKNREE